VEASGKLRAYLELVRAHNLLGTVLGVIAGAALLGEVNVAAAIASASAAAVAAGGYAINDYFDVEIDKVNKPERPIPSGRVGAEEARKLALALLALGPLLGLAVGPLTGAYAALNAVLMYYYSKSLKKTGLPGNLAVSFSTASTLLYGSLATAEWAGEVARVLRTIPIILMVFLMTLAREVVKGVEDYVGDKEGGVKTLAVVKGPDFALRAALALACASLALAYLAAPLLSLGYAFLAFVTLGGLLSLASVAACLRSEDPVRCAAKPRRAMKVAMFLGLIGILVDRLVQPVFYPHVLHAGGEEG